MKVGDGDLCVGVAKAGWLGMAWPGMASIITHHPSTLRISLMFFLARKCAK